MLSVNGWAFSEPTIKREIVGGGVKDHLNALGIGMCCEAVIGLLMQNLLLGLSIGAALGVAYEGRY